MNTKALNSLADLICRAQENGKRTPMGIAMAIDSAGRHMSPETALEMYDLRTRLAAMANPPRELYLAQYEGVEPELFTTVEAAREYCDDVAPSDAHGKCWDWTVNEHGIHVQFWTHPDDDRPMSDTSGYVTPIVVQGDEPLSELERLRAELAVSEQRSERRRIAWRMARTRALSTGSAADRYAERARQGQEALQNMLFTVIVAQMACRAARQESEELRSQVAELLEERHSTNESLSKAAEALRANRDRIVELERPAVERHRREVRESYRWLASHAREDGDFEGEAVVVQQLAEREQLWRQEDKLAREFAADPLAAKPWEPGPSAEASADKLTALFAPRQALREDSHDGPLHHSYRVPRDLPETGGSR